MRLYTKPELHTEAFDVEDVITVSGGLSNMPDEPYNGSAAPMFEDAENVVEKTTLFPQSTVENPSGAFQQQVTGGNFVQEGLNNLYENFLSRF